MANNIIEKIEGSMSSLTAKQQQIAIAIVQDPLAASYSSINVLAEKIGVSPASIVRFAQQITGEGYPQLQAQLQAHIQAISNPIQRLELNLLTASEDALLLTQIYENQIINQRRTFTQNLITSATRAEKLISSASHIYTGGSRGSYSVAYYLGHHLNRVLRNTDIISDDDRLADQIFRITEKDLVILVCAPRYSEHLLTFARQLHARGVKLITLNDAFTSPFVAFSEVVFLASHQSNDFHNSLISYMLVAEMLISLVISRNTDRSLQNLREIEPLFSSFRQFNSSN